MRAQLIAAFAVALLIVAVPACLAQGWDAGTDDLWDARTVSQTPTQSWFGGTGMIVIPTADIVEQTRVTAHYHAVDVDNKDDWEDVWGVTASFYPGIEAGVTHLGEAFTGTGSDELGFQAKGGGNLDDLLQLGPDAPNIAIGGRDLGDQVNETYFVVFSKGFPMEDIEGNYINVSAGIGTADGSGVPLDGFFFGVDISPFDFARLQVEHDGENINAALRYWWSEWAVTEVGVLDGDLGAGVTLHTGW